MAIAPREAENSPMYRGERLNTITHLVGAAAALAGLAILVFFGVRDGDGVVKFWSLTAYGITLFLLYLFSVLFHSTRGEWRAFFGTLDHVAIYLLIAGTYTPFMLIALTGPWGKWLFVAIWCLAIAGILVDTVPKRRHKILAVIVYVLMGWLCLLAIGPLLAALWPGGFIWLLAGGLCYSCGVIFYVLDHIKHFHGIWHLFVLAGSACHYVAILLYVL